MHTPFTHPPEHSASAVHRFGVQPTAGLQIESDPHELGVHFARKQIPVATSQTEDATAARGQSWSPVHLGLQSLA